MVSAGGRGELCICFHVMQETSSPIMLHNSGKCKRKCSVNFRPLGNYDRPTDQRGSLEGERKREMPREREREREIYS